LAITKELLTPKFFDDGKKNETQDATRVFFLHHQATFDTKSSWGWKKLISLGVILDLNYSSCTLFFQCKVTLNAESSSSMYCLVPSLRASPLLGPSSSSIF
jgi:hypothetical protein